jgi:fructokinase
MNRVFGGVEAGGTKFVCAVGSSPEDLRNDIRIPTTTPQETLERVINYFREQGQQSPLEAVGIAAFGPLDLHPASTTYGYITATPKPGWAYTDLAGTLRKALDLPVAIDTDVNTAALGEHHWGAAQGLDTFIYLTIGTGIGGGGLVNGKLIHGLVHPEMGHIRIPHNREKDPYPGWCPFHGDCFEGLANGPAMKQRWGQPAETLPPDHPAWTLEAEYLASAICNFILTLSPQRIVIGGGVMEQAHLLPMVRRNVQALLNGYVSASEILGEIDHYIVSPRLGKWAGVLGAIALAQFA